MLLKLRHTHPFAVTFLLFLLPADFYLFTCLAFCSASHSIAVAAFRNAILQCAHLLFLQLQWWGMGDWCCRTGQCLSGNASQRGHCGTEAGLGQHGHQPWGAEAQGFIAAPCSTRDRGTAAGPCGCLCLVLTGFVPTSSNRCSCLPALRFAGQKLPLCLNVQNKSGTPASLLLLLFGA